MKVPGPVLSLVIFDSMEHGKQQKDEEQKVRGQVQDKTIDGAVKFTKEPTEETRKLENGR